MESLGIAAAAVALGPSAVAVIGMCGVVVGAVLYVPFLVLSMPSEHAAQLEEYRRHTRTTIGRQHSLSSVSSPSSVSRHLASSSSFSASPAPSFSRRRSVEDDFASSMISTRASSELTPILKAMPSNDHRSDSPDVFSLPDPLTTRYHGQTNDSFRSLHECTSHAVKQSHRFLSSSSSSASLDGHANKGHHSMDYDNPLHIDDLDGDDSTVLNDELFAALQRGEGPFRVHV